MSRPKPYDAAIDAAFELGKTDKVAARRAAQALGYDPNVIVVLASDRQKPGNAKNHDICVVVAKRLYTATFGTLAQKGMI